MSALDGDYDCMGGCPNCAPDAEAVPYVPAVPSGRCVVDGYEFFYESGEWTWEDAS